MRSLLQLESLSALFLTLPLFLFVLNWLHLFLGLALAGLIITLYVKHLNDPIDKKGTDIEWKFFALLFIIAFIWVLLSGIGGFTYQNGDWKKHYALFFDLVNGQWPVVLNDFGSTTGKSHLVYYLGYYLAPASIGKIFGWKFMTAFLIPYTAFAVALAFYWLRVLTGHKSFVLIILFTWTSGLDVLGWLIMQGEGFPGFQEHIEFWNKVHMQYSSTTSLLFWVPQQALGAWIGIPLILNSLKKQNWNLAAVGIVCLPLWSPFLCLGLSPFVAWLLFKGRAEWRKYLYPGFVVSLFAMIFYSYYSSPIGGLGILSSLNRLRSFEHYTGFFLFHIFEYLIFFIMIFWCWSKEEWREHRAMFSIALLSLMLIPLWESRLWNDWAMRVSIPALYLMWVWLLQAMFNEKRNSLKYTIIGILLIIGSVTPFKEYERSIDWFTLERRDLYPARSMSHEFYDPLYKVQYFSDGDTFFHKYLSSQNDQ